MDKQTTIWLVIGVYAVFMLAVGILYSRKGTDMAGFTVGGRSAGAWISALSYGTAYFSAVMFIGYSGGSGWSYGLWSVLVGIGNAVFGSLLAWMVLADRTREYTRKHDIKSMPQLFEKRFGSAKMRLFACVVIFVFLIPYSASVYKGLTSVCSVILGIDEQVCMVIIAIASALLGLTDSPMVILIIMNLILLVAGTFMDVTPAILIFTPLFLPIVKTFGMHPVQFGLILVYNLCIGNITPPVGNTLFVSIKVGDTTLSGVMPYMLMYYGAILAGLLLVTYVSSVSMYLPMAAGLI